MSELESVAAFFKAVDGYMAVAVAVWVITLLTRLANETGKRVDKLIENVDKTNKDLIGLLRDKSHEPAPALQPAIHDNFQTSPN